MLGWVRLRPGASVGLRQLASTPPGRGGARGLAGGGGEASGGGPPSSGFGGSFIRLQDLPVSRRSRAKKVGRFSRTETREAVRGPSAGSEGPEGLFGVFSRGGLLQRMGKSATRPSQDGSKELRRKVNLMNKENARMEWVPERSIVQSFPPANLSRVARKGGQAAPFPPTAPPSFPLDRSGQAQELELPEHGPHLPRLTLDAASFRKHDDMAEDAEEDDDDSGDGDKFVLSEEMLDKAFDNMAEEFMNDPRFASLLASIDSEILRQDLSNLRQSTLGDAIMRDIMHSRSQATGRQSLLDLANRRASLSERRWEYLYENKWLNALDMWELWNKIHTEGFAIVHEMIGAEGSEGEHCDIYRSYTVGLSVREGFGGKELIVFENESRLKGKSKAEVEALLESRLTAAIVAMNDQSTQTKLASKKGQAKVTYSNERRELVLRSGSSQDANGKNWLPLANMYLRAKGFTRPFEFCQVVAPNEAGEYPWDTPFDSEEWGWMPRLFPKWEYTYEVSGTKSRRKAKISKTSGRVQTVE